MTIANEVTLGVIRFLRLQSKVGDTEPVDLRAGADGFFALLGTDNGKGVARMLAAYPQMFGRKTISCVRIYTNNICWFLEDEEAAAVAEVDTAAEVVLRPSSTSKYNLRPRLSIIT